MQYDSACVGQRVRTRYGVGEITGFSAKLYYVYVRIPGRNEDVFLSISEVEKA